METQIFNCNTVIVSIGGLPEKSRKTVKGLSGRSKLSNSPSNLGRETWLNSAAAIGAVIIFGGGLFYREQLISVVQDTVALYNPAGMDIYHKGLEFSTVKTRTEQGGGRDILVVEGSIRSITNIELKLPMVRLALRSDNKRKAENN